MRVAFTFLRREKRKRNIIEIILKTVKFPLQDFSVEYALQHVLFDQHTILVGLQIFFIESVNKISKGLRYQGLIFRKGANTSSSFQGFQIIKGSRNSKGLNCRCN